MSNLSGIDILVLCGGKGIRMASVVKGLPKVMLNVADRPFLEYFLSYLESSGFKRVILCTGYKSKYIENWINDKYSGGLEILISREQILLGTGGAIKNAQKIINSEHFFVMNGDSVVFDDFTDVLNFHLQNRNDCTILVKKPSNTRGNYLKRFGSICLSEDKKILSFSEKNKFTAPYFNAGIYVFKNKIMDIIESDRDVSLEYEVFPVLLKRDDFRVYAYISDKDYIDIGTVESFKQTKNYLIKNSHRFSNKRLEVGS